MDVPSLVNAGHNSESDDDYMSEAFVTRNIDVRPGLAKTVAQQRILKIEAAKRENNERLRKIPRRSELEKQMRDAGLAKPVGQESKGFTLLQKMGYKPGMSLGVQREGTSEGIKQPIVVDVKSDRTGLGHDAEEKVRQQRKTEMILKAAIARSKANVFLLDDFQKRKRALTIRKQIASDVAKSRKACEDLDIRKGLTSPTVPDFWPVCEIKGGLDGSSPLKKGNFDCTDNDVVFKYSNGELAPLNSRLDEMQDDELHDRLEDITAYLRNEHYYCIWCGCQYDSKFEVEEQCPGNTRAAHEGSDDE